MAQAIEERAKAKAESDRRAKLTELKKTREKALGKLREAVANKEPILILAPHLGCWEVLNFWLAREFGLHAMFAPSGLPELDALVKQGVDAAVDAGALPAITKGVVAVAPGITKGGVAATKGVVSATCAVTTGGEVRALQGAASAGVLTGGKGAGKRGKPDTLDKMG